MLKDALLELNENLKILEELLHVQMDSMEGHHEALKYQSNVI
jgi:hypothetical protein